MSREKKNKPRRPRRLAYEAMDRMSRTNFWNLPRRGHEASAWLRGEISDHVRRWRAGDWDGCEHLGPDRGNVAILDLGIGRPLYPACVGAAGRAIEGAHPDEQFTCDRCATVDRTGLSHAAMPLSDNVVVMFSLCDECCHKEGVTPGAPMRAA